MAGGEVSRAAVEDALRAVEVPDGADLLTSGRVRSLVVQDGRVGLAIAARREEEAAMEAVRREAEARVGALEGVSRVLAALVEAEPGEAAAAGRQGDAPAGGETDGDDDGLLARVRRLAAGAGRRDSAPARSASGAPGAGAEPRGRGAKEGRGSAGGPGAATAPARAGQGAGTRGAGGGARGAQRTGPVEGVSRVLAVGAGKGGVGKSTVSFNLAVALAATGWRVGLLDADIYGPSVPTLVGAAEHVPAAPGGGFRPFEAYGIRAMSVGFLVEPGRAMIWRGPMVTGALNQLLRDTRWGTLDCLIVDMPPGTGDIALSLAQQTPLTGALVVTTPQDLSLIDVRKAAAMFRAVNVPVVGIIENMSTFVCPRCGEATAIFGEGGGAREAQATGVPLLGEIPLTMDVRAASDAGRPVALDEGPVGDAYRAMAADLAARLSEGERQPFPQIVFE